MDPHPHLYLKTLTYSKVDHFTSNIRLRVFYCAAVFYVSYPELSEDAEYHRMESSIRKTLRKSVLRTGVKHKYSSLKEFGEHLKENQDLLTYRDSKNATLSLSSELIRSSTNSYHVIFYDTELISEFDQENPIFIDSTFKVRPDIRGVSQFMTIMAKKYNAVSTEVIQWSKLRMKNERLMVYFSLVIDLLIFITFMKHKRNCCKHNGQRTFAKSIVLKNQKIAANIEKAIYLLHH